MIVSTPAGAVQGPTEEEQARASQWYEMAIQAVRDERWSEAAMAFDAAHALDPAPELLYNAGRAYHKSGQLERARERYSTFLIEKDASEDLRKKVLEYTVELELELRRRADEAASTDDDNAALQAQLEEERRAREDAEARARLEARLAEAERRNRELDQRLAGGGTHADQGAAARPGDTVRLTLYNLHGRDAPTLLTDSRGQTYECAGDLETCEVDLPPGEVRLKMKGVTGSGRVVLRPRRDMYVEAKVIQAGSTSGGQIAGMVLLGAGAVALSVGPLVWYAVDAAPSLVSGRRLNYDGLFISLGVAGGLMLVGGVLWAVMPDDYTPTFITRERRYAESGADLGPTLGFTLMPVQRGALMGAVGTF